MANSFENYQRRKLISSYFSVVLSIALVLFLLGILGLLVLNTKKMADRSKEQITISIFLKENTKDIEVEQLQKTLAMSDYTKSSTYVSKEEAAKQHSEDIGEDFVDYLGYNPLKNSIDLKLNADFVTAEKVAEIAETLSEKSFVDEVSYDKVLVSMVAKSVEKISFWILVASAIFTFIAVLLINSSIRLSIYSKRFIIKTMQMVGANKDLYTKAFYMAEHKIGHDRGGLGFSGHWWCRLLREYQFSGFGSFGRTHDIGHFDGKRLCIGYPYLVSKYLFCHTTLP